MRKILFFILSCVFCLPAMAGEGTRVVFMGDSITDGNWGMVGSYKPTSAQRSQTDMNHIYGHSYVTFVATYYECRWPGRDYKFFNRGFSGHRLPSLADRWQEDVLDLHPDVLSVLVGTNDINFYLESHNDTNFDVEAWKSLYRSLLQKTRDQNPDLRIVLCTPFTARQGWVGEKENYALREEMIAKLSAAVRELCDEFDAVCVPFDTMFSKLISKQPRESFWIWDGIHPTQAGHRRMSELWVKKVGRL